MSTKETLEAILQICKSLQTSITELNNKVEELKQQVEETHWLDKDIVLRISNEVPRDYSENRSIPAHMLKTDPNAKKIWASVLEKVKERITTPSFDAWFSPTKAISIDGDTLFISTPNDFSSDWLTSRYTKLVVSLLPEGPVKHVRFGVLERIIKE